MTTTHIALAISIFVAQYFCVTCTDGDEVDFNDAQAVQRAFYRLAVRQADVHRDILDVQRQQLTLQQHLLDLETRHPSVLTDMVLYTAVIACVYLFVKFMRRYGLGVVVCLFVHYCSLARCRKARSRHQVAPNPRMPPSVQAELISSAGDSELRGSDHRITIFGVKNYTNEVSAL